MNGGADRLIKRLGKAAAKKQEVNIWRMLGDLTMDVVGTASFGWVHKHQVSLLKSEQTDLLSCKHTV